MEQQANKRQAKPRKRGAEHIPFENLPDSALVRRPIVLALIGFSSNHLDKMIGDGRFPRPYRLSPRISVWKAVEIRRWLANQGLT